ncbi:hypothetical protein mvi_34060 [Methylobacterium indicum]|uniref:Uncharacterized protein n=1 Tax=Methylobacterium indicum TaxID=1775910 RepID=A0A8H8WV82_9HYPH|nr:hypothetical protein mvi_34060 [Methylobacterium indicum]
MRREEETGTVLRMAAYLAQPRRKAAPPHQLFAAPLRLSRESQCRSVIRRRQDAAPANAKRPVRCRTGRFRSCLRQSRRRQAPAETSTLEGSTFTPGPIVEETAMRWM